MRTIKFAIVSVLFGLVAWLGCSTSEAAIVTVSLIDRFSGADSGWDVTYDDSRVDSVVDRVSLQRGFLVIEISKDFYLPPDAQTGLIPPISMDFIQRLPDGSTLSTIIINDESITNLTGVDWTDFHWQLLGNAWFDVAATGTFGIQPVPHFQTQIWQMLSGETNKADGLSVLDGTVPNWSSYFPGTDASNLIIRVNLDVAEAVSFTFKQHPTVPEPATVALLTAGTAGIVLLRKATGRKATGWRRRG